MTQSQAKEDCVIQYHVSMVHKSPQTVVTVSSQWCQTFGQQDCCLNGSKISPCCTSSGVPSQLLAQLWTWSREEGYGGSRKDVVWASRWQKHQRLRPRILEWCDGQQIWSLELDQTCMPWYVSLFLLFGMHVLIPWCWRSAPHKEVLEHSWAGQVPQGRTDLYQWWTAPNPHPIVDNEDYNLGEWQECPEPLLYTCNEWVGILFELLRSNQW